MSTQTQVVDLTEDVPKMEPKEPLGSPPPADSEPLPKEWAELAGVHWTDARGNKRIGQGFAQESQQLTCAEMEASIALGVPEPEEARMPAKKRRRSPAQTRLVAEDIQRILLVLHSLENHVEDIYFLLQELGVHRRAGPSHPLMSDEEDA